MSGSRTGTIDWGRKTPGRSPYLFGWPTAVNSIKFSSDGWFSHIYAFPLHIILLNLILVLSNVSLVFFAACNLGLLNAMFCELEYHLWINWRIIHHCAPAIYVWITWFLIAVCVCVCVSHPPSPPRVMQNRGSLGSRSYWRFCRAICIGYDWWAFGRADASVRLILSIGTTRCPLGRWKIVLQIPL